MAGEPWCKLPHEIALLTDFQILHLYVIPAHERSEAAKLEQKGIPSDLAWAQARGQTVEPSKDYVIGVLMSLGIGRKAAEEEYKRQQQSTKQKQEK